MWVLNDRLEDYNDTVILTVYRMDGSLLSTHEFDVSVPANSKLQVATLTELDLTVGADAADVVCVASSASCITEDNFIYSYNFV